MFGTMGFSELIIILVIMLIIFGAGRLPQIGEGVGKALKGFRKEVNEVPQPPSGQVQQETGQPQAIQPPTNIAATIPQPATGLSSPAMTDPTVPYAAGPELTPGTTASLLYNTEPQASSTSAPSRNQASTSASNQVLSMEERAADPPSRAHASYPPLPAGSHAKPKRPSAIVNKDAVARVQAQQAALKAKAMQSAAVSPEDLQHLGEGLGGVVRTFRKAVTDVRHNINPQISLIQAEMDATQKEIQQSIEAAKELPPLQEDGQKST